MAEHLRLTPNQVAGIERVLRSRDALADVPVGTSVELRCSCPARLGCVSKNPADLPTVAPRDGVEVRDEGLRFVIACPRCKYVHRVRSERLALGLGAVHRTGASDCLELDRQSGELKRVRSRPRRKMSEPVTDAPR